MKRFISVFYAICLFALLLLFEACPGPGGGGAGGGGSDLAVKDKDFSAPDQSAITITVTFTKGVDRTTVVPTTSLILYGLTDNNATGKLTWGTKSTQDDQLTFTSDKPWPQILSGNDRHFTLTLKASIRAKDGSPMDECKTGKPGTEPPGDCVLEFSIPG
jgi:hypothetical protein